MARRPPRVPIPFPIWFLMGLATLVSVAWFVINIGAFFLNRRVDVAVHGIMGLVVGACLGGGAIISWRRNDDGTV